MIRELRALLNRVLGRPETPPPAPRLSSSQRAAESGIRIEYQGDAARPPQAPASVTWQRERHGVPRFGLEGWRRRISTRKRVLLVLGALSLVAQAAVLVSWLFVERRLPPATFGVWTTDTPGYADRMFELRARRMAFVTRDSAQPVTVHLIQRVRRAAVEGGVQYTVDYQAEGGTLVFQFIYSTEPESRIRFVNQPRMVWRRPNAAQSIMRDLF